MFSDFSAQEVAIILKSLGYIKTKDFSSVFFTLFQIQENNTNANKQFKASKHINCFFPDGSTWVIK